MKKVNVNEASGPVLDWMVAKCEGIDALAVPERRTSFAHVEYRSEKTGWDFRDYSPSTDWAQGGPVIEREGITLRCGLHGWDAELEEFDAISHGPTALIAAARCYVASKLGEEVEVPDELM